MTLTLETANALDVLAAEICDCHFDLTTSKYVGINGLMGPSPEMDTKLATAIAPVMLEIDGRTLVTGLRYTLNVTNALQLRPKRWFMHGLYEWDHTSLWPASMELAYMPWDNGGVYTGGVGWGQTIGLATCCAIVRCWAAAIRMRSQNNYPPAPIM